jgi:hypothetical protein
MDELPGSFLFSAKPDGFERVILIIIPRRRECSTSSVGSILTEKNTVDDI